MFIFIILLIIINEQHICCTYQLMASFGVQMLWPHLDVIDIYYLIFDFFIIYLLGTSICTDVIVLRLLFIFNSGMECRTLSQRCGRLYFPIFLFRLGLFPLMYMASLEAVAILCPSLPTILKFSTDVLCPVLFWCSKMYDAAF